MEFPTKRMRRLRKSPQIRDILRETRLHSSDLIYPIFVSEKLEGGEREAIDTMPGQYRYSVDDAVSEASRLEDEGFQLSFYLACHPPRMSLPHQHMT